MEAGWDGHPGWPRSVGEREGKETAVGTAPGYGGQGNLQPMNRHAFSLLPVYDVGYTGPSFLENSVSQELHEIGQWFSALPLLLPLDSPTQGPSPEGIYGP
jgi:hypothetical protein